MLHKHQLLSSPHEQGGADTELLSSHMTRLELRYEVPCKKWHDNKMF